MDLSEIRDEVKLLIVKILGLPMQASDIGDDEMLLNGRLYLDSMATVELLSEIESTFDIEIEDDVISRNMLRSPNTLAEMIERHLLSASKEQSASHVDN